MGPNFSGDTIKEHAKKKSFSLIPVDNLLEIAQASQILGLGLNEISLVFNVPEGPSQLAELISSKKRELNVVSMAVSQFNDKQEVVGDLSPRDIYLLSMDTELSPSQEEFLDVFKVLSGPDIEVLGVSEDNQDPENKKYHLEETSKVVNRLIALANAIKKGLD